MKQESDGTEGWRYARFRIRWDEETEPLWHIDMLLAHRVAAPLLQLYRQDIPFWRFHRRAARDEEGHQFSLTFYSGAETARRMMDALKADRLLRKMKREGMLLREIYDDPSRITAPRIQDTSDGNWSPEIRKTWPFFIMGVCEMWLSLISDVAAQRPDQPKSFSLPKMIRFYQGINDTIKTLWRDQGAHSMLHHLNAIFGYEPLLVREVNLRRF